MIDQLKSYYNKADINHPRRMKIMRYIISGGMATATNLLFLFILTDLIGVWYVLSAVFSYVISFVVSFSMQKYWTFKDNSSDRIGAQAVWYISVTTANLGLNTLGIFLLVHYGHFHYLLAQLVVSLLIAIESFFIYRLVFRSKGDSIGVSDPI
jgi:putative flippase GtrA